MRGQEGEKRIRVEFPSARCQSESLLNLLRRIQGVGKVLL